MDDYREVVEELCREFDERFSLQPEEPEPSPGPSTQLLDPYLIMLQPMDFLKSSSKLLNNSGGDGMDNLLEAMDTCNVTSEQSDSDDDEEGLSIDYLPLLENNPFGVDKFQLFDILNSPQMYREMHEYDTAMKWAKKQKRKAKVVTEQIYECPSTHPDEYKYQGPRLLTIKGNRVWIDDQEIDVSNDPDDLGNTYNI